MNNGVSIIISARNEFPQICMTIDNLMMDLWQSDIQEWEIIIADNGSTDLTSSFWKYAYNNPYAKNSSTQLIKEMKPSMRGMANERRVRFCYDPVFSNVGARHKAVQYAKYENIIFADAHISLKPNTIKYVLEDLRKYGGIIHVPVSWMGASIYNPSSSYQYSYKIGEKIWGTWNRAAISTEDPFFIPSSGHCFFGVLKKEYLRLGGYDMNQRVYGGGEPWLDTLYWMMGSHVMCEPKGLVFHLSAGRGYNYDMNSLIHNMILTSYALGGYKWAERIYIAYLDKLGTNIEELNKLYKEAIEEGQEKRNMIEKRAVYTLEEVLAIGKEPDCEGKEYKNQKHAKRLWDIKNDELHGKHLSFVVIFDDWLTRLKTPWAKEFYANSLHQK